MRKAIFFLLLFGQIAVSQVTPGGPKLGNSYVAGILVASNFGQWRVPPGNLGQYSWNNGSFCQPTVGAYSPAITMNAFTVGTPVWIIDMGTPAHSEIVTPTSVTILPQSCSINISPVYGHNNFYFATATGGLQEALNWAGTGPYIVQVTPDWTLLGGTTGMLTAATGTPAVSILDERSACLIPYLWNGAIYTEQGNLCSGGSGFTINSFTGCARSLELGQTVTNPTCVATYTGVPSSASITNTDMIDSPLALVSPFTSGTIVGSFHHSTIATTTVTLTAIGLSTQTATQQYTWQPRIFGGVGTAGATSTVTASGATAVLSTSDALPSAGLGAETVGQTFGPYTPSAQNVYLLLLGGSHTFIDAGTGFPCAFNPPITVTFVNEFGVTVTMYLYQSTNPLYGTYTPKVAS